MSCKRTSRNASTVGLGLALCVLMTSAVATACTTHRWVGPADGNWLDDANWDPVGPIAVDDKVKFDTSAAPVFASSGAVTVGGVDIVGAATFVQFQRAYTYGVLTLGDVNIISAGGKLLVAANGDPTSPGVVINSLSGQGDFEVQSIWSTVPYVRFDGVVDLAGKFINLCNGGSATNLVFWSPQANPTWKFGSIHLSTQTQDGHCHTIISSPVQLHVTGQATINLFAHLLADQSTVQLDSGVTMTAAGSEIRAQGITSAGVCDFSFFGGSWLIALGAGGVTCNGVTSVAGAEINIISAAPDRGPVVVGSVTGGATALWLQGGSGASSADINIAAGATVSVGTFKGTFTVGGPLAVGGPLFVHIYNPPVDGVVTFTAPAVSVGAATIGAVSAFTGTLNAASLAASAASSLTIGGDLNVACGGAVVIPGPALHVAGNVDAGTCPPPPQPMLAAAPAPVAVAAPATAPAVAPTPAATAPAAAAAPVVAAAPQPQAAPRLAKLFGRTSVSVKVAVPVVADAPVNTSAAATKHTAAEVAALIAASQAKAKAAAAHA